jgi:hypothetical protein
MNEEDDVATAGEEEGHPRRNISLPWHDENWISFRWAASEIKRRHGLSLGAAQRTLRELCADGDVRSVRYEAEGYDLPDDVALIRPSEWLKDQIDFEADDDDDFTREDWTGRCIDVSEDDLQHWLDKQAQAAGQSPMPITTAVRWIKRPYGAPKARASRKLALARIAISKLWSQGIPETVSSPQIEKQVDDWITKHCKKNSIQKPVIGRDTILRAAGRRQQ